MTVKQAIEKCAELKNQISALENEKTELENKIKNYMQKKNVKKYDSDSVQVQYIQVNKLIYDIENMRKYLSKELLNDLTDKEYEVDGAALNEFLAENPEMKSRLKQIISVSRTPNKNKIEKAFDDERITEKDVLKFTEIKTSSYLKYNDISENDTENK